MDDELKIQQDRMRFTKNTASSRLAILAIIFNVFFFISIYKVNQEAYYTFWMGISIVYNLVFMLLAFLASEGVKNYKMPFSFLLLALTAGQIARIFIYPAKMLANPEIQGGSWVFRFWVFYEGALVKTDLFEISQYARLVSYMVLSAACLAVSAVVNLRKSHLLAVCNTANSAEQA